MIAQIALGISFQWMGLSSNTRELVGATASDLRAGGTIGGANGAAAYIAMLLPISIVVLWMDFGVWIKRLSLVATGVGIVALVLTYSRGGWLAAIVAAVFVTSVAVHRGDIPGGKVAAAGAVVLVLLVPFHGRIEARISGQTQGGAYSQNARLPLIQLAWKMIQDRPILGVGANNFAPAVSRYAGPEFSGAWLRTVHSLYFLAWAEAGFGALLALLWFLGSSLRRGWQSLCAGEAAVTARSWADRLHPQRDGDDGRRAVHPAPPPPAPVAGRRAPRCRRGDLGGAWNLARPERTSVSAEKPGTVRS